ncbi:TraB/GumN family protein [Permianibacter sp. IMCC34836]|uniref:TraB/GumN family protein n=1 Tax=Permianibacter fluminis TaxID=2738515 RepID=UPI00155490C5|nr:TraB/GumN family protein [Permianibacter fluminis]NQD36059.1 TraB/GumN family protein [Permianibacter fluminis]
MSSLRFRSLPILLLLSGLFAAAPTVHAAESLAVKNAPLLWRVEGNGIDRDAAPYLFGTIHIPDPRVTQLHPAVEAAFKASTLVLTELKLDLALQAAAAQASLLPAPQSLSAQLTPALRVQLETELKAINSQLRPVMFDRLKPWALATQLALLPIQLKNPGVPALDFQLAQRAEAEGKTNEGLEQLEEQLIIFDRLSQTEQLALLKEALDALAKARKTGDDMVEQLTTAYLRGDEADVQQLLEAFEGDNKALNDKLSKALLDDRNQVMTKRLLQRIKTQPKTRLFVAVGAAHLIGDKSIVALLRQQGYTVTRIER